ncbi:MAG: TraB/GumN family protein [Bacteroidota bacterium]
MRSLIKFCFLALISFVFLALSSKKEVKVKSSGGEEVKTSLLWKIEGNGLSKPSYLFGTMHLIQKEYFYFPSSLEKIIKKSDLVVMELSMEEMNNQTEAMKYLVLKEGKMMDYFDEKQQDSIYTWAKKKLFIDKTMFDATFSQFKPFVLVQTAIQMSFIGKTESYEMTINDLAVKHKIKTLGLEKMAEQMKIFDDLTREQQASMVMEGIRDEEKTIAEMNKMQGIYKRQKLDSLYIISQEMGDVFAEIENEILINRNKRWIEPIEKYIKSGQTFIAVGAAHLPSEFGVIELLRKKGYTVSPVKI